MNQIEAPCLIILFNRPEHTKKLICSLAKSKPKKLYVSIDGPRNAYDSSQISQIKEILHGINWPVVIKYKINPQNLGCKVSVSSAISWFFESEEYGIILEDDCVPNEDFFRFCTELLYKYRYDERVISISGTNLSYCDSRFSYYFAEIPHIWGWATWKRIWDEYDPDLRLLDNFKSDPVFKKKYSINEYNYWVNFFENTKNSVIDTWDVQFTFLAITTNRLSIFPTKNLVSNIGFDEHATHTKRKGRLSELPTYSLDFPLVHPPFMINDINQLKLRNKLEGVGIPKIIRIIKFLMTGYGIKYAFARLKNAYPLR